ncbi:MAG TPA: PAS domain-containing protein [Alphaproteobacteria bacterium]|jgi:hypothetical protein|nr:PAS domain-containing protein [Alphaproteobacteria bacterium]
MADDGRIPGTEQRLVMRLLVHWRELAGGHPMPDFEDFDPWDVPELWEDSFLIDARDPSALVFHSVGDNHIDALGRDPSTQLVSTVGEDTLLGRAVSYAAQVIECKQPMMLGGVLADSDGNAHLYRSILMPLAHGRGLALLGAANSRIVTGE